MKKILCVGSCTAKTVKKLINISMIEDFFFQDTLSTIESLGIQDRR